MREYYCPERKAWVKREKNYDLGIDREIVSDTLGIIEENLPYYEADRKINGFSDIEFIRDEKVPQFYQVKCGSVETYRKYMKHRGYDDKSGVNGAGSVISKEDMKAAEDRVIEKYGTA